MFSSLSAFNIAHTAFEELNIDMTTTTVDCKLKSHSGILFFSNGHLPGDNVNLPIELMFIGLSPPCIFINLKTFNTLENDGER